MTHNKRILLILCPSLLLMAAVGGGCGRYVDTPAPTDSTAVFTPALEVEPDDTTKMIASLRETAYLSRERGSMDTAFVCLDSALQMSVSSGKFRARREALTIENLRREGSLGRDFIFLLTVLVVAAFAAVASLIEFIRIKNADNKKRAARFLSQIRTGEQQLAEMELHHQTEIRILEGKLALMEGDNSQLRQDIADEQAKLQLLQEYRKERENKRDSKQRLIRESEPYRRTCSLIEQGRSLNDADWEALRTKVEEVYPAFREALYADYKPSPLEYRVCVLIILGFKLVEVGALAPTSKQNITSIRKRIIQHIGGPAMRPADCDTYLMSLIE